jgi:hypothetical protein
MKSDTSVNKVIILTYKSWSSNEGFGPSYVHVVVYRWPLLHRVVSFACMRHIPHRLQGFPYLALSASPIPTGGDT